jgi:hypothetical protein
LVDWLSIDEAYESIGADMPDHIRCRSRAHLFRRVPTNTRRRAREVSGRAKPSMMIAIELYFFENMTNKIINLEHIPMEPLTFYTR